MNHAKNWINEIVAYLQAKGVEVGLIVLNGFKLNDLSVFFVNSDEVHQGENLEGILVHEDYFRTRKNQILMRLNSQLGLNKYRIHGRLTKAAIITKDVAKKFVDENHLMGFGGGKVFLGLFHKDRLVSVAVFSSIRLMKYETPVYRSAELERYCSLAETTITGGLDKLVQFYFKNFQSDDIVTSVDLEWSEGNSFQKIGFKKVSKSEPLLFAVNRKTFVRRVILSAADSLSDEYLIHNRGNLKLRLSRNLN